MNNVEKEVNYMPHQIAPFPTTSSMLSKALFPRHKTAYYVYLDHSRFVFLPQNFLILTYTFPCGNRISVEKSQDF